MITRCIKCGADLSDKETITAIGGGLMCNECAVKHYDADALKYLSEEVSPTDVGISNTVMMCAACDKMLRGQIWAADGIYYCSRECAIHDFSHVYGDRAEEFFEKAIGGDKDEHC